MATRKTKPDKECPLPKGVFMGVYVEDGRKYEIWVDGEDGVTTITSLPGSGKTVDLILGLIGKE